MSVKGHSSYSYEFCDETHSSELLDVLHQFHTSGLFTDIALRSSSGQVFHCHKVVLSARSSYFKLMFTLDMRERENDIISLPCTDGNILGSLINYVYTSKISITQTNVQSLLEAADLLQFTSVKKACENFLIRLLDIDNCLGMHSFAELHVCSTLQREASRVMLGRFAELTDQEEFYEVDFQKLKTILTTENLNVWKEETLLESVVKWVAHDTLVRTDHLQELLACVHLEVDDVYLRTALDLHSRCSENKLRSLIVSSLTPSNDLSHCCKTLTSSLYVIGGYYWHPLCEVHTWDPISNTWTQRKDMPDFARESYSVVLLGPNIYVTGGYRTETVDALDTVWIYETDTDEWTEGCPMLTARYYHCSVALRGCIYAIGGYTAGAPTRETEFYDPLKKKWLPVADMIQGVGNASACVINDRISVTGGHYGCRGSCTFEKIQMYRADVNEWSIITICPHPEYGLCSVSLNNKLYLVGGQTTITDCYDPKQNEWRQMAKMKERRMECGAAVINGFIYVAGGYSYSKGAYLQSIERYDPEMDCWEIVGNLPSAARSHGCVCVFSL
ncbi:kelch-like protein 23 isoform X2 [Triplophysa rosa]|uniref:Kelch-like protein 23 n=2 Tax=Triplophysa rosa TaxID=992332 RepID=A0A9W7WU39_TRIRA|nr:kelch-like protein 23 isoform X2 [Triplophysa rosa]KAI7808341.1 putative kelch-like protein 23 [Triplophysa rosa]